MMAKYVMQVNLASTQKRLVIAQNIGLRVGKCSVLMRSFVHVILKPFVTEFVFSHVAKLDKLGHAVSSS